VTAIVVLIVLVVVVDVVDVAAYVRYRRRVVADGSFIVCSSMHYAWLGIAGLAVTLTVLLTDHSFWAIDVLLVILLVVSLVLSVVSLPGVWEMRVKGDDLSVRRFWGRGRSFTREDVSQVVLSTRRANYHMYLRGEERPSVTVNGRCEGILDFSSWLERSGIKVELKG